MAKKDGQGEMKGNGINDGYADRTKEKKAFHLRIITKGREMKAQSKSWLTHVISFYIYITRLGRNLRWQKLGSL